MQCIGMSKRSCHASSANSRSSELFLLQVLPEEGSGTLVNFEQVSAVVRLLEDNHMGTVDATIEMHTVEQSRLRDRLCAWYKRDAKPTTRLFVVNTCSTILMAIALTICSVVFLSRDNISSYERSLGEMRQLVTDAVVDFAYVQSQVLEHSQRTVRQRTPGGADTLAAKSCMLKTTPLEGGEAKKPTSEGGGGHRGQTSREGEEDIWWTARTALGGTGHLGLTHAETH